MTTKKKSTVRRMKKFLVEWEKGDEERAKRVERALKIVNPIRVELTRSLLDEWAKIILAREVSDVEQAARIVAGKKK